MINQIQIDCIFPYSALPMDERRGRDENFIPLGFT